MKKILTIALLLLSSLTAAQSKKTVTDKVLRQQQPSLEVYLSSKLVKNLRAFATLGATTPRQYGCNGLSAK